MARQDYAEAYARQAFQEILGRDPTTAELAQVTPVFMGSDPNIHDIAGGRSAVAQIAMAEQNNPDTLAAKKRSDLEAKAPGYYSNVDSMFQSTLGRSATDAEKKHFGSLLADGSVDEYSLGSYLQNLPEYVTKQDKEFRDSMSNELQTQDQRYYSEKVLPSIAQDFARKGRSVDSSGYASALALAAQDQNKQRESFLSNLSASQYAGNKSNARADYETLLNNYYKNQNYSRDRQAQLSDATTGRINELQNYNIQKQAYEDYLRRYGKRSNAQGIGSLVGGVAGGAAGAYFGGPAGMSAGYQAGSGLGGGIGSFF